MLHKYSNEHLISVHLSFIYSLDFILLFRMYELYNYEIRFDLMG